MHKLATGSACMAVSKYLGDRIKDHPEESQKLRRFIVLAGRKPFQLRLTDDSMGPNFPAGTELVVRPYNGEHGLVVAMVNGEILFRRLDVGPSGQWLISSSPEHHPIEVTESVHLLGVPISAIQNF